MTLIESEARPDLVRRATEMVDLIRKHAAWSEENRRLHPEVVEAGVEAELWMTRVPKRYGGSVADLRTIVDLVAELARADGSVGWSSVSFTMGTWMAALIPDDGQDDLWSDDPSVLFCGSISPTGIAVPTEGGYVLNGEWHFNTGSPNATWDAHFAMLQNEDGSMEPVICVVPVADLTMVDDWYTSGLRGTGSRTTIAKDLFVPENRLAKTLPIMLEGKFQTEINSTFKAWNSPFMQKAIAIASAPALGMARHALEEYLERAPQRAISYTHYSKQSEAPITHLNVGKAIQLIAEAEFHLYRQVERLDSKLADGSEWTNEDKAVARMDAGAVFERSKEAVDILANSAGASSIYYSVPLQQIQRDMTAIYQHGIMYPETNLETLGRIALGLEPNTDYL